ncbi:E3 ubiquitin-protein ligase [Capsicum chinense]|nr:E3 ubiquitin-protein ligase [Capsicum chinense]
MNDGNSNNNEREFCLRVDRVQESSVGVSKKRNLDTNILEIQYAFDDFNVREILNALFDFFTLKKEFLRKVEDFVGKIQKFRVIKSGLKIMKLKMKNVATFELGDICLNCLKNFEEESVVVITPCSHKFHRSCVFTWLSKNNSCPICRKSCYV